MIAQEIDAVRQGPSVVGTPVRGRLQDRDRPACTVLRVERSINHSTEGTTGRGEETRIEPNSTAPTTLVVSHEASRTGAPRVAVELLHALREAGHRTVVVHRWGGPLEPAAQCGRRQPPRRAPACRARSAPPLAPHQGALRPSREGLGPTGDSAGPPRPRLVQHDRHLALGGGRVPDRRARSALRTRTARVELRPARILRTARHRPSLGRVRADLAGRLLHDCRARVGRRRRNGRGRDHAAPLTGRCR